MALDSLFGFIHAQLSRQKRDGHLVEAWLERKGVSTPLALEVMLEFANRIEKGEKWGFNEQGLSELDHAILVECMKRQGEINSIISTKVLQELAGKPLLEKETYDLADLQLEMGEILYERISGNHAIIVQNIDKLQMSADGIVKELTKIKKKMSAQKTVWQYIKQFFLLRVF